MKALALDFDGVISDSAPESFVVALRTYTKMRPASRHGELTRALGRAGRETVSRHPVYHEFVRLMPLGNRAEDFAVALWLIDERIEVNDQAAYDVQRAAQPASFMEDFHERFYAERRVFSRSDRAGWLALLGPYQEFLTLLRRRADDVVLALATAKDRSSVEILLRAYGVSDLFPDDRILDKETGVDKRAHLKALHERLGVDYSEITFVDDKVNHLQSVARLGVRCALASWGYNGERERDLAEQEGYLVCDLSNAEERLFQPG